MSVSHVLQACNRDKGIIMERCYVNESKKVLGLFDDSVIFNMIIPAGWTIKRYHGNLPQDIKRLETILKIPYIIERLDRSIIR